MIMLFYYIIFIKASWINNFFQQGCDKLIKKVIEKTLEYLEKNAVLFNFLFIKKSWKTLVINQHRMIFKGSCETEDWSNDAENSDLPSQKYTIF